MSGFLKVRESSRMRRLERELGETHLRHPITEEQFNPNFLA